MLKTSRFTNQCRACRRISSELTPVLAKLEDFEKLTIKQCIETSLGITCELSSNLPSKFCEMCLDELKITYVFTEKYKESDIYFKRIVQESQKQKLNEQEHIEMLTTEPQYTTEEPVEEQQETELMNEVQAADEIQYEDNENDDVLGDGQKVKRIVQEFDVLEGYEELVLDENSDWLEQSEEQHPLEEDPVKKELNLEDEEVGADTDDEGDSPPQDEVFDIIVEEIDESQLPSILHSSESIPINEEEVLTEVLSEEESINTERFTSSSNTAVKSPIKKKMVFSIAEATKKDGTAMEVESTTTHYFEEPDTTEHISVSKRPKPLSIGDLEKKNVIPMIKSIPPSKIDGGSTVEVDGETFHKCDECDRRFTKRYLLKSHIKTVHLRIREHCCPICPKQFTSKLRLEEHFRIHTGERPFKCEYCPMAFTTPTQRKLHSITHTRSNPYSCEYCGKTFSSHATLHGHKFIHTRKGVECPVCKKMFARQVDVKKHMAVHTKEKSFVCKICDKGYLYNTSLKAHMKNHLFENVQCKDCEEDINNIDQWNYHQQLHAKEVFECTSCGTTFMEQHELFTHLRTAHSTLDMTQQVRKETPETWIDN